MDSKSSGNDSSSHATGPGPFLTPLLISIAGIVATAFTIVTYHLLVHYCMSRRRRRLGSQRNAVPQLVAGVDAKILESIPILTYSTKNTPLYRVDQSDCAICLGDLADGDRVRLLPGCRHTFHVPCIAQWFSAHASCPICRSPIMAPPVTVKDDLAIAMVGGGGGGSDVGALASRSSSGFLKRCVSQMLPVESTGNEPHKKALLRRSLSVGQSHIFVINIVEDERGKASDSCSSSSGSML